jgi:hypothetical protein
MGERQKRRRGVERWEEGPATTHPARLLFPPFRKKRWRSPRTRPPRPPTGEATPPHHRAGPAPPLFSPPLPHASHSPPSTSPAQGLDYVLAEARARGLRVILALTSNWGDVGSVDEYVAWSPSAAEHDDFFSDAAARDLFLKHAAAVTGRVNSITGIRYADDPTIFAWNLINEPRCYRCGGAVADWVGAVAPAVKKMAPNQLLTIGEEGFYGRGGPRADVNPGGPDSWAGDEGQDFLADHASPAIDFFSIHMWPGALWREREEKWTSIFLREREGANRAQRAHFHSHHSSLPLLSLPFPLPLPHPPDNWKQPDIGFAKAWLAAHAQDAAAAGKPLVLEEHGKWLKDGSGTEAERNAFFKAVLADVYASASSGGPVVGSLFWSYQHPGQEVRGWIDGWSDGEWMEREREERERERESGVDGPPPHDAKQKTPRRPPKASKSANVALF